MNIKLNNIVRQFMTLAYIVSVFAGVTLGLLPFNLWSILLVPLFTGVFLLLAYFLNIYVEHRYITYPFQRNAQVTLDANQVLNDEIEEQNQEIEELTDDLHNCRKEKMKYFSSNKELISDKKELNKIIETLKQNEYKSLRPTGRIIRK